ncbi:hypothetical protein ABT072_11285 [Streptomyces sp. NPDC002589]|uniref:hypothetical protein n=1 Tax=Streptomyces sp. NPDC002589 TaxID=3154420 RepID=UPI00331E1B3F
MAPSTTPGLAWGSGFGLGPGFINDPGIGPNADDRLQTFVQGGGRDLYTKWQNPDGSWVQDWVHFDDSSGKVDGTPVALRSPDGILHVFWRGPDNGIWEYRQQVINGSWAAPVKIASNAASDPAPALNADGRISVFYSGIDASLWHVVQQQVNYGSWVPQQSLGGGVGNNLKLAPTVARNGEGRLEVFVTGHQNEVWGIAQKAANATTNWVGYFPVSPRTGGAPASPPAVTGGPFAITDADQRVRVFWRAGNVGFHAVEDATYTFPATPQPQQLPAPAGIAETPAAILAMDGRLEVFLVANDRSLWVTEQQSHNEDTFTPAQQLGGYAPGRPVPARYADNRILVPHRGSDNGWWAYQQVRA